MNKWLSEKGAALLHLWRALREDLSSEKDTEILLKKTTAFFSDFPLGARTIDYYTPSTWPDPWAIIYDSMHCEYAQSLMIYYTIQLAAPHLSPTMQLVDLDGQLSLIVIADKYALNFFGSMYEYAQIKDKVTIRQFYKTDELPKVR